MIDGVVRKSIWDTCGITNIRQGEPNKSLQGTN